MAFEKEYIQTQQLMHELAKRYEEALLTMNSAAQSIKQQYTKAAMKVESLRLGMAQTLASSSHLLA